MSLRNWGKCYDYNAGTVIYVSVTKGWHRVLGITFRRWKVFPTFIGSEYVNDF
jgi:hypothetical protein